MRGSLFCSYVAGCPLCQHEDPLYCGCNTLVLVCSFPLTLLLQDQPWGEAGSVAAEPGPVSSLARKAVQFGKEAKDEVCAANAPLNGKVPPSLG